MARCAVCLLEFRSGEKFALVDEFVMHRSCVGGVVVVRDKAQTMEREATRHAQKYLNMSKTLDAARDGQRELRKDLAATQTRLLAALEEIGELNGRLQAKDSEISRERTQRALAEVHARSVKSEATEPISTEKNEPVDITAVRFGLLELD